MKKILRDQDICCHGDCDQGRRECPMRPSNVVQLRGRATSSPFIHTNTHRPVVVTDEQCRDMDDTMSCAPAHTSVGNTSGSKLADVIWFWLPITARVKLLTPGVNWWRVLAVLLCLASAVGVLSALILASGLVGPQA